MTRGRWALAALGSLVLGGFVLAAGATPPHAVSAGLGTLGLVALVMAMPIGEKVSLPRLPFGRRDGARTEVASLSWALLGDDGASLLAQRTMQQVARTALAEHGVDIDNPDDHAKAINAVGPSLTDFLLGRGPVPDARAIYNFVLALERLEQNS